MADARFSLCLNLFNLLGDTIFSSSDGASTMTERLTFEVSKLLFKGDLNSSPSPGDCWLCFLISARGALVSSVDLLGESNTAVRLACSLSLIMASLLFLLVKTLLKGIPALYCYRFNILYSSRYTWKVLSTGINPVIRWGATGVPPPPIEDFVYDSG